MGGLMTGRKPALLRAGTAAAAAGTVVALLPLAAGATRLVTPDATQQAKLTGSDALAGSSVGSSVAISNSTAAVSGGGALYVFVRSSSGAWEEQAKLARPGRTFGAVAVSGDTIVAGAAGSDVPAGAADVFVRSGGTWTFQAELASIDGASRDGFGFAVALFGPRIVVGSPF